MRGMSPGGGEDILFAALGSVIIRIKLSRKDDVSSVEPCTANTPPDALSPEKFNGGDSGKGSTWTPPLPAPAISPPTSKIEGSRAACSFGAGKFGAISAFKPVLDPPIEFDRLSIPRLN